MSTTAPTKFTKKAMLRDNLWLRGYAILMLGPRKDWPSITDYMYACLIEQFCDAALAAVKVFNVAPEK